jgi:hypothetical protein
VSSLAALTARKKLTAVNPVTLTTDFFRGGGTDWGRRIVDSIQALGSNVADWKATACAPVKGSESQRAGV